MYEVRAGVNVNGGQILGMSWRAMGAEIAG